MIKQCGWRECNNFFTVLLVNHRKTFCGRKCSQSSARENWNKKNQDYRNSKHYRDLCNERRRWRYHNEPGFREKVLDRQKEREERLTQDPAYVQHKRAIKNKYNTSEKGRKRARDYVRDRSAKDLNFRLRMRLRSRLYHAVFRQDGIKEKSAVELLGCTTQELIDYLQSQFLDGMTWDNYGEWEIDHIKPCAAFDLRKKKEQRKCFHYTNLQPLWGDENRAKADKYENNS